MENLSKIQPVSKSYRKVLLVEDCDSLREFFSLQLQNNGMMVDAFRSGVEALDCMLRSNSSYDLALINYLLPQVTGDLIIHEIVQSSYPVKVVALFTSLDETAPVVTRLKEQISHLIDFHYIQKTPHSLAEFLMKKGVKSPQKIQVANLNILSEVSRVDAQLDEFENSVRTGTH